MDGALKAQAVEEDHSFPFVFDLPDFLTLDPISFPHKTEIQLAAFAQEFQAYDSEEDWRGRHPQSETNPSLSPLSFIPSGLFSPDGKPTIPPQAYGIFTGIIKDARMRTNRMTGVPFFWMLVDSLGGEVDVVAHARKFRTPPLVGGIVQGQFWLSGKLG